MSICVAEYLGVRVERSISLTPVDYDAPLPTCPFRNDTCEKVKKGNKPVCSVRDAATQELWIVCPHRLCASSPKISALNPYQIDILHTIAKYVYSPQITVQEVLVKREVGIPVTRESTYSADFVMWRKNPRQSPFNPDRAIVLEMQSGGETTNTGRLTAHVAAWENDTARTNTMLALPIKSVAPLITNAWRRQQEQFLVKGNVAMFTGGRMVFCVSTMLYKYLTARFRDGILADLQNANWTLALITFEEDTSGTYTNACCPDAIPLKIGENYVIYTNYASFVQVLTNQGAPHAGLFVGEYYCLNGTIVDI